MKTNFIQARRQWHADMNSARALERTTRRLKGLECTEIYQLRRVAESKAHVRAAKALLKLVKGNHNAALLLHAGCVRICAAYSKGLWVNENELPVWFRAITDGVRYTPQLIGRKDNQIDLL